MTGYPHTHDGPVPNDVALARHLGEAHGYHSSNDLENFGVTHFQLHAKENPMVSIEVTLRMELPPEDVWPDGAPDNWTVQDVVSTVQAAGSFRNFLREWDFDTFGAEVSVSAKGQYGRGHLR